jgi:hypothetical protein
MNLVPLLHGDHVHLGQVYVLIFQFFLEIAAIVATTSNENAGKILESFQAAKLPNHQEKITSETETQRTEILFVEQPYFSSERFEIVSLNFRCEDLMIWLIESES